MQMQIIVHVVSDFIGHARCPPPNGHQLDCCRVRDIEIIVSAEIETNDHDQVRQNQDRALEVVALALAVDVG